MRSDNTVEGGAVQPNSVLEQIQRVGLRGVGCELSHALAGVGLLPDAMLTSASSVLLAVPLKCPHKPINIEHVHQYKNDQRRTPAWSSLHGAHPCGAHPCGATMHGAPTYMPCTFHPLSSIARR